MSFTISWKTSSKLVKRAKMQIKFLPIRPGPVTKLLDYSTVHMDHNPKNKSFNQILSHNSVME